MFSLPSFLQIRPAWTRFCTAFVTAALAASIWAAGPAGDQIVSGEGRAVLGSSMTPEETKRLSFEKARQSALQKFGAHVRSSQVLKSASS